MTNNFTIHDAEWAKQLEKDYEEYIGNCYEMVEAEFYEEPYEEFQTLSGEPFCGCSTCHTRETLFFYTPRLLNAAAEGKVTLEK